MSSITRSICGRLHASGSYVTPALPAARLTLASCTPGSPLSAFSTLRTQAAQVMPATGRVSSRSCGSFALSLVVTHLAAFHLRIGRRQCAEGEQVPLRRFELLDVLEPRLPQ